ncbi:hypothetical protein MLD38_027062 [Melastoma candidum]|uniref:Uncharacterized protein n=1 Tax=Melastoma candidum TaxID=119954 RepID=A0ACB9P0C7_9MYRT|nr:hypothetical protein MLD38_027062 [Melastoma candidum]
MLMSKWGGGSISGVEAKLPPGFRFHPRDDELVCDYLLPKLSPSPYPYSPACPLLSEVDLNKCEPWDIPPTTCVGGKEWYFYSHLDRKYATGSRTNRATASGYWKATGKDRPITRKGALVGMRKTLVFYLGRAPKGRKTNWVMHEFRVEGSFYHPRLQQDEWVLCRVFNKSGDHGIVDSTRSEGDSGDPGRSSPPRLMDPCITYPPTRISTCHLQQVPCFSNYTVDQMDPQFALLMHSYQDMYSGITDSGSSLEAGDERVLNSVLSQLAGMDSNPGFEESVNPGNGSFPLPSC